MLEKIPLTNTTIFVIGLAETNVGSDAGSVVLASTVIPGYKPFYQDTYNNKEKGQELPLM